MRKKLEKYTITAIYKSVKARYAHSVFGMKTVRKVLVFFDKQFIIMDGVRGLVLKKEYQEYKFTTIQSLKN
jgi:hypothetical protein